MFKMFDCTELTAQLTLEEASTLLHGADFWRLSGVPRLGVPSGLKLSDGPNGCRGKDFIDGATASLFPAGVGLAATFDTELAFAVGTALAKDCKSKSASVLLGPTVNIHRSPLGGRNFESFSEDPVLSGKMASGYIRGLQEHGVTAVIKHFICNDSEETRRTMNVVVDETTLREVYLRPFQIAFATAQPHGMMTSYNKVNGTYVGEQKRLLQGVVRGEWGVKDLFVTSDWWGTYSLEAAVLAGMDLEMPFGHFRGDNALKKAAEKDEALAAAVKERAANILGCIERSGGFDLPPETEEVADDDPETRNLIRTAAAEGSVLLKNNGILPLNVTTPVAAVGVFAKVPLAHGGGSASLNPHRKVSPFEGLSGQFDHVQLVPGVPAFFIPPTPTAGVATNENGQDGCDLVFRNADGSVVERRVLRRPWLTCLDEYPQNLAPGWTATMTFTLCPQTTGEHLLFMSAPSKADLYLDDRLICSTLATPNRREDFLQARLDLLSTQTTLSLEGKRNYRVRIVLQSNEELLYATSYKLNGVYFGFLKQTEESDVIASAVATAEQLGTAVVCVGHGNDYETEGFDRETMSLLGKQDALIHALAKSSAKVIVAIYTGSPISMPWLDEVDAVVQCFFPGQELGHSLADILSGKVNPSGRLPVTIPKSVEDTPSFGNFPGTNETVHYEEGLLVGYKHYVTEDVEAMFPFGHGLSYTAFALSDFTIAGVESFTAGKQLRATVTVTNTGSRPGRHTVLAFVSPANVASGRPVLSLEAFGKTRILVPGDSATVKMVFGSDAFSQWEGGSDGHWRVHEGEYNVELRDHAAAPPSQTATIVVARGWTWAGLSG